MVVQLPVVYGDWTMKDSTWHFEVDNRRGGRMFCLCDGFTHKELVKMVQDDYNIEKSSEVVELTYSLPTLMLQHMAQNTPPMHVTNDRQVQSLIELSRTHVLRLCVSSRFEMNIRIVDGDCDVNIDADTDEDQDYDHNDEKEDEDECANGSNGIGGFDRVKVEDEEDIDANYSDYGKVKDEDEEDITFDAKCAIGRGSLNGRWSAGIFVNQSFRMKDDLLKKLRLTAVMQRFAFKVYKSTRTLFVAVCRVTGCKWKVRVGVKNEPNRFWVTKYSSVHTCSLDERVAQRKNATPKYIGRLFIERVGIINIIKPEHIQDSTKVMFGMTLDYTTSYRALIYAQALVRGTAEDGYENLLSYLHMIEKANPGMVTGLQLDCQNRFKYLFIAFGASIAGFQYLRRVLVVDGTHLSGKYEGVMLVAAGQDANFQIFPLAFGIVGFENDASWTWFFNKLNSCISDQYLLVIVSDRHKSIKKACHTVFPWATRGICYYHLQCNILMAYRGKDLLYLVKGAAYVYTEEAYNRYIDAIRMVRPELAKYLEDADPKLWSRVHYEGDRYNIKTSNIAESINAALKVARGFLIVFLLEFIRAKLGRWFYKRRENAFNLTTTHSRGVEYLLTIREHYASEMTVEHIDGWKFLVKGGGRNFIVDFSSKKCTCGLFQTERIPCSHAIAAFIASKQSVSTEVCPSYRKDYLYAAYAQNITPIIDELKGGASEGGASVTCLPPEIVPCPGRKKKSRWQSYLELARRKEPNRGRLMINTTVRNASNRVIRY